MILHCFFVPSRQPEPAQGELNAFLAAQRVLSVQREWLADGAHSGWAFCVEVLAGALKAQLRAGANRKSPGVLVGGSGRRTLPGCLVSGRGV